MSGPEFSQTPNADAAEAFLRSLRQPQATEQKIPSEDFQPQTAGTLEFAPPRNYFRDLLLSLKKFFRIGWKRYTLDADEEFMALLDKAATENGLNRAQVIHYAVASYAYLKNETETPNRKIALTDKNGSVVRDVILP